MNLSVEGPSSTRTLAVAAFAMGSLCLVGLPLRALRSRGTEPAVLVAVSRR